MKILHVLHGYPPNVGGVQNLFREVSERLARDYGDAVTVFTTNAYSNYHFWQADPRTMPAGRSVQNGVVVHRFPVWNRLSWLRLNLARVAYKLRLPYHDWARALYNGPIVPGLAQAVAACDADVVVAASFPLLHMHAAQAGARRSGRPLLFFGALHPEDRWGFDRRNIFEAIRRADGYLAATPLEHAFLAEKGVDPAKMNVTGAGVDAAALARADGAAWRQAHGLGAAPLLAFVGQQAAHKGIDTLIAALPRIWAVAPQTHLAIAGKPTAFSAALRRQIAALPQGQAQVHIFDAPAEAEKNGLLAACDVLALPSRHESFGMVLVEAWACGKPVVAAAAGGVPYLVDDGADGLLVPPGDAAALAAALGRLLQDGALRRAMGTAGRRKVMARYSWEAVTARFRAAYQQAAQGGGDGPG